MEHLPKKIHQNSISYTLVGDYYIPDLKLAEDFSALTLKAMPLPAEGRSSEISARNCATGRRTRNVSGCCVITCICWIFCCPAVWRNGPAWSLNTEKR